MISDNGSLTMKRAGLSKRNIAKRKTMLPVDLITGAEHSDNIVKMKTINATAKLDMEDDDAVQYTDVNIAEISCKDTEQVIELKDETEAITFDGSFINFEVSAVDGLNEFTIDENWEADEHVSRIKTDLKLSPLISVIDRCINCCYRFRKLPKQKYLIQVHGP